jgi:hypothetical protein
VVLFVSLFLCLSRACLGKCSVRHAKTALQLQSRRFSSLSFLAISRAPKSWCESQNALCEWRRVASCAAEYMSRIVIVVITPVPHFQLSPACNAIAACQDSMPAYQQQYIPHSFFSKKAAGSTSFREFVPSLSWQMVGFQGIRSHKRQSKYRSYL